jgi:hypothetical protein
MVEIQRFRCRMKAKDQMDCGPVGQEENEIWTVVVTDVESSPR